MPAIATAKNRKIPRVLTVLLLFTFIAIISCGSDDHRTLAVVAETCITRADLAYKIAIEKAYGDTAFTEQAALVALINDAFETEVARMHGIAAAPEDLKALDQHASKTSKAPEILAKIKQIFGHDIRSYERIYLQPKIINYKLHAWFSRDVDIHKSERTRIERAHRLALTGMPFDAVARACKLAYSVDTFRVVRSQPPSILQEYPPSGDSQENDPMLKIFSGMKAGEIYHDIIEDDVEFKIIKLIHRIDSIYSYQRVAAKKMDFDKWYGGQGAKIPVQIMDQDLRKKVVESYPELWWVKTLEDENINSY
ncbi:MAG TPA: hypothetical protein VF399_06065 [bacterium]